MAFLAEEDNTLRLPLRRPNKKRSVWTEDIRKGSPEGEENHYSELNLITKIGLIK